MISVLLSTHNAAPTLEASLKSIIQQTEPDWEALVMDDGSTDATPPLIQTFARQDSRIRCFRHERKAGLTHSLLELAAQAKGQFLMRQDADDWSESHRMERQRKALEQHPQAAVCSSWVMWHDNQGEALGTTKPFSTSWMLKRQLRHRNPLAHGSLMLRTSAYREVGGYREAFTYAQDYDLLLRLSKHFHFVMVPEVLYHLRLSPAGIGRTRLEEQHTFANASRKDHDLPEQSAPREKDPRLIQATHLILSGQARRAREMLRDSDLYALSFLPTVFWRCAVQAKRLWELR